jgi:hypothetical protein
MYYLSKSRSDRVKYDKFVRAYARERLRAANLRICEIDPIALARRIIKCEGLPETDDPEKARARYLNAFQQVHAKMLRKEIYNAIRALPVDIGDIAKHIQPCKLLWMPNSWSLEELSEDAAGYFEDGFDGKEPDGDLLLAPVNNFDQDELAAALEAGGEVVKGYEFYYPGAVCINRRSPRIIAPGKVAVDWWCGYYYGKEGYALRREVAEAVCAASIMMEAAYNDAEERIKPCKLLWMPNSDSLKALGDAARHFSDNGKKPDGDAWYAPADAFSPDELAAAERAGGEVVNGYCFPYQRSVAINSRLPCDAVAGEVKDDRWCGYPSLGIGYAVWHDVAKDVCAASIAREQEESESIKQKVSASCMPSQLAP